MKNDLSTFIRWKLILGNGSEQSFGNETFSEEQQRMNIAMEYLYDREYGEDRNIRTGGLSESNLTVPLWINEIHELFPKKTIERIEKDALERYQIMEMVTNPELLKRASPNTTLLKAVLHT